MGPIELILNGTGLVHNVIAYEAQLRNPMRLIELRRRLIAENVQFAVYLSEANRTSLELFFDVAFLRLCGIKLLFSPLQKSVNPHRVHPQTGVYERKSNVWLVYWPHLAPWI